MSNVVQDILNNAGVAVIRKEEQRSMNGEGKVLNKTIYTIQQIDGIYSRIMFTEWNAEDIGMGDSGENALVVYGEDYNSYRKLYKKVDDYLIKTHNKHGFDHYHTIADMASQRRSIRSVI